MTLAEEFSSMGNAILDLARVQERLKETECLGGDHFSDFELERLTKLAFRNANFHHPYMA